MSEKNASTPAFYILVHFFAVPAKHQRQIRNQMIGFVENVNTRQLIFLSVFELESRPYKLSLLDNSVIRQIKRNLEQLQSSLKVNEILTDIFLGVAVVAV